MHNKISMTPKLCMAPMRGLTGFIYRNTFSQFFQGIDYAVAPFISSVSCKKIKKSYLKDVLPENNTLMPVIPQILSKSPNDFIVLAQSLYDLGYDTINWNLGCPFSMVAKKGRGSGMLPFPDLIDSFLEKIISEIPNNLSIKTRLGRNSINEIFNLMPVFNRYPLKEIIIHPRTGIQMYEGVPNLDIFEECLLLSSNSIVYNGDINTLEEFHKLSKKFQSVNCWMIGRGILKNPFLPSMIKENKDIFTNKIEIFQNFHEALFNAYAQVLKGPSHLLTRMKGFWSYFAQSFTNSSKVLKKIRKTQKTQIYIELVNRFLEKEAKWRF